jgi:hypothetical protein
MKAIKNAAFVICMYGLIFILSQCSKDTIVNNDNIKKITDGPTHDLVDLFFHEYVLVTPSGGGSQYYEWRPYANFSCSNCFNPHVLDTGSFVTPLTDRYDDNGDYIVTQYFLIGYNAYWFNENAKYGACWSVYSGTTGYLDTCVLMTPAQGSSINSRSPVYFPANTRIYVSYGTTPVVGDKFKK